MTAVNTSHRARIILAALVLILGAYWAGSRFGSRQPTNVEAVPLGSSNSPTGISQRDATLTNDESINGRISRQASPAVPNILNKPTDYDYFMYPVPLNWPDPRFLLNSHASIP